jgi:hypothetical protein
VILALGAFPFVGRIASLDRRPGGFPSTRSPCAIRQAGSGESGILGLERLEGRGKRHSAPRCDSRHAGE